MEYPSPKPNFNHLPFTFHLEQTFITIVDSVEMYFHVLYLFHNLSLLVVLAGKLLIIFCKS
jgi:hypothetical protein